MAFTSADRMEILRYENALSKLTRALQDGDIDEPTHAQLEAQTQARMKPLLDRKMQSEQEAEKAQQELMTKQHVQMQMLEAQAAEFRAEQLSGRIVPFVDPLHRRVAYLYESKPGTWEEIEFKGQPAEETGGGE